MVKCTNNDCPIKDKCKRGTYKSIKEEEEKKSFEYTPVKNKEGVVVGYTCQFQIFV